jgi:hypothetical protein
MILLVVLIELIRNRNDLGRAKRRYEEPGHLWEEIYRGSRRMNWYPVRRTLRDVVALNLADTPQCVVDGEDGMDNSGRRVRQFLEKEIKTYQALALFFAKRCTAGHVRVGDAKGRMSPSFYKERMKEARQLVGESYLPS